MKQTVCIMAGGGGTRLYPLSQTEEGKLPKQFLSVIRGKTLLQKAIERIPESYGVVVIPEARYSETVEDQASQIGRPVGLIDEPFGCNTAAAILYTAALYDLEKNAPETVLCFIPADHEMDDEVFGDLLDRAISAAAEEDRVVTIGISPVRPETNYGYIQVKDVDSVETGACDVARFVEKPDKERAAQYLADGGFFWNAGIFAAKARVFLSEAQTACPDLLAPLLEAAEPSNPMSQTDAYTLLKSQKLNKSIDYALMERIADSILLIPAPAELEWNDLGNWESLRKYMDTDDTGNAWFKGTEATFSDSEGVIVCNYTDEPVTVRDMKDTLIVVTDQGVLVRPSDTE